VTRVHSLASDLVSINTASGTSFGETPCSPGTSKNTRMFAYFSAFSVPNVDLPIQFHLQMPVLLFTSVIFMFAGGIATIHLGVEHGVIFIGSGIIGTNCCSFIVKAEPYMKTEIMPRISGNIFPAQAFSTGYMMGTRRTVIDILNGRFFGLSSSSESRNAMSDDYVLTDQP